MNTKTIGVFAALAILLGGAWLYLSLRSTEAPSAPEVKEFALKVENNKLVSGPETLNVRQGDTVVIKITADADEELHLHGYDRSVDLTPGVEESLTFVADVSGRFPYELEHSKTEIGSLQVQP